MLVKILIAVVAFVAGLFIGKNNSEEVQELGEKVDTEIKKVENK